MDQFAQSRGEDDLFDDEIVPLEQSPAPPTAQVTQQLDQVSLQPTAATFIPSAAQQHSPHRVRGRDRGGAAQGTTKSSKGLAESRFAPKSQPTPVHPNSSVPENRNESQPQNSQTDPTDSSPSTHHAQEAQQPDSAAPPNTKPRPLAVRGDRSATGGFAPPKLSESELTAKLAAAKQRSHDLSAAHARAQADKESFDERERVARERREKEEKRRKEMEGEREKNRRRKLDALIQGRESAGGAVATGGGGREWDRDKIDLGEGSKWEERARERDRLRVDREDLREYVWDENRGRGRGRGGGRGRGRGRGGRGGGRGDMNANARQENLNVSAEQDFPSLPVTATSNTAPKPRATWADTKAGEDKLLPAGTASWADQVEHEGKVKW
jgi:hypothetical protein